MRERAERRPFAGRLGKKKKDKTGPPRHLTDFEHRVRPNLKGETSTPVWWRREKKGGQKKGVRLG